MKTAKSLIAAMALALCITAHAESPASLDKKANDAHALVGKPVQTDKGEKLGKVNDVIVDEAQGNSYAIISYGQKRFAAVPLDRVHSMMKNDAVVLDRSELEHAPTVKDQEWRKHGANGWSASADKYWQRNSEIHSASPNTSSAPSPAAR